MPLIWWKNKNGLLNLVLSGLLYTGFVLFSNNATAKAETALKDNSPGCSCYVTSGWSTSHFAYHRFHDFRALPGAHVDTPSTVIVDQNKGKEETTNVFFDDPPWTTDWNIQDWAKNATADASVRLVNSAQNVYIDQERLDTPTYLTLRTTRLPTFQSTAEVESLQKNLLYASIRLRARVIGDSGAVAGMFLYYDDNNESDIEILTSDPSSHIRYSNQPTLDKTGNEIPASSNDVTVPQSTDWTAWNEHRIDWLAGQSAWYINGINVANMTYGVPKEPSSLTLNIWSDGGVWGGNMTVGDEAYLQIQWIEMVFNTSGPVTGPPGPTTPRRWLPSAGNLAKRKSKRRKEKGRNEKGCKFVCTVDGVKRAGFPEHNGKAVASGAAPGAGGAVIDGDSASSMLLLLRSFLPGLLAFVF